MGEAWQATKDRTREKEERNGRKGEGGNEWDRERKGQGKRERERERKKKVAGGRERERGAQKERKKARKKGREKEDEIEKKIERTKQRNVNVYVVLLPAEKRKVNMKSNAVSFCGLSPEMERGATAAWQNRGRKVKRVQREGKQADDGTVGPPGQVRALQ